MNKLIVFMIFLGLINLILSSCSIEDENEDILKGIEFVGKVVSKQDYDGYISCCVIKIEHSTIKHFIPEDEYLTVEVCDSNARIIFRRGIKIGRKFFEESMFDVGSTIKFNLNNDLLIREFRGGEEINRIKAIRYKRPEQLESFCK